MELNGVFDNIIRKVKRTVTLVKNQQTKHDLELICNDWISVANYPRTKVSLCGKFNAGKSALINALFNKKIVISKPISSTGVITKIYYSEHPEYFVIKQTDKGEVKQCFSPEQIKDLTVKDNFNNSENVRDIIRVEIGYPLMQLQEGLEIYDTPGLEDIDPKMNEITFSHIDETDFIIFVIDAMQLKDLKELLLRYYNYLGKNVIFVANKMDAIDDCDREEIRELAMVYFSEYYNPITFTSDIFFVSAIQHNSDIDVLAKYFKQHFGANTTRIAFISRVSILLARIKEIYEQVKTLQTNLVCEINNTSDINQKATLKRQQQMVLSDKHALSQLIIELKNHITSQQLNNRKIC